MIVVKSRGVYFDVLTPGLVMMFAAIVSIHKNKIIKQPIDLVITALKNGVHSTNSRHYTNEAIDLRSKNFPTDESKLLFCEKLQSFLGPEFTVLMEDAGKPNEHFHIQVKKGLKFT